MNSRQLAVAALIISSIIWGAGPPIFQQALEHVPVGSLAFIRFAGATLLLLPFMEGKFHFRREDLGIFLLVALSGITFNILFFFWGLTLTSSINAGVIATATPIFTLIGSVLILKEKVRFNVVTGTVVALLGILVIIAGSLFKEGVASHIVGNFILILATIVWAYYMLVSKKLFKNYHVLTITFYSFLFGSLSFLPLVVYEYFHNPLWIYHVDSWGIFGMFFGIFFSSFAAYFLWQWGLSKIDTCEAGVFIYIDPVVAALIAVPLRGEVITIPFLLGTLLVFLGVYIVEKRFPYHPFHKLKPSPSDSLGVAPRSHNDFL